MSGAATRPRAVHVSARTTTRDPFVTPQPPIEAPATARPDLRTAVKAELCRRFNITPRTFDAWRAQHGFPKPIQAPGLDRWFVEDVTSFLRGQEVRHG
jgi:hypothetical protein